MKILWTLRVLAILLFCERVASERRLVTTEIIAKLDEEPITEPITEPLTTCRFAQLKCSYRTGCGATLQSFLIECDSLIHNRTNVCSNRCKNTLVGLTSTLEGQKLMSVSVYSN